MRMELEVCVCVSANEWVYNRNWVKIVIFFLILRSKLCRHTYNACITHIHHVIGGTDSMWRVWKLICTIAKAKSKAFQNNNFDCFLCRLHTWETCHNNKNKINIPNKKKNKKKHFKNEERQQNIKREWPKNGIPLKNFILNFRNSKWNLWV